MKTTIHKTLSLTLALLLAHGSFAEDVAPEVHFSKPSKAATADLRALAKIAAPDNPKSDFKEALDKATQIQNEPDFAEYTHSDLAFFYGYLGWLSAETGQYPSAINYYTFAVDNYSRYDQKDYNIAINQLLALSIEANQADEVYNDLHQRHFPLLPVLDLLTFAELYSQSMRFDLAQKLFSLADEKSKTSDEYDRYLYFASYIKNAALHKQQDTLKQLAEQYTAENKTVMWNELIAWKNKISEPYYPIVRVAPNYPSAAAQRRIRGYATVEMTVTDQGTVKNVSVIDEYPEGYFAKPSINAAKKFKFNPFLGPDGIPMDKRKVYFKFLYQLQ